MRSIEHGSSGAPLAWAISSGVRSSHAARPNSVDRHAVFAEMPIDEHGDDPVVRQTPANLQGGVQRLPHLDRFRAQLFADLQPDAIDRRVRLRHRDNRERQIERAANQQAADFPIPVMPGDEHDPLSSRKEALEHLPVFVDDVEQLAAIPCPACPARAENRSRHARNSGGCPGRAAPTTRGSRAERAERGCRRSPRVCWSCIARPARCRRDRWHTRRPAAGCGRRDTSR